VTLVDVVYRSEGGKTRALIVGILDEARGPLEIDGEVSRLNDLRVMRLRYCERHRDHRAFLAVLAAMPAIEALERVELDKLT
jgi:hypothetical protein